MDNTRLCAVCNEKATRRGFVIEKMSACCGKLKFVHKNCAKNMFTTTHPNEEFNAENWHKIGAYHLYCVTC